MVLMCSDEDFEILSLSAEDVLLISAKDVLLGIKWHTSKNLHTKSNTYSINTKHSAAPHSDSV